MNVGTILGSPGTIAFISSTTSTEQSKASPITSLWKSSPWLPGKSGSNKMGRSLEGLPQAFKTGRTVSWRALIARCTGLTGPEDEPLILARFPFLI
jgi:hypothetical protein